MTEHDKPAMKIEGESCPILCGQCGRAAEFQDGNQDVIGCRNCDTWLNRDEAIRIVTDYAKDEMQLRVNRMMQDTAKGSGITTFNGQTEHSKQYKLTVDF